jgi:hypothetical protein
MPPGRRGFTVAALCAVLQAGALGQPAAVLHIRVTLPGAGQAPTPIARHALLVSDNPASAVPRRIVTGVDGRVTIRLAPGNYTVESDRPLVFDGREYSWTQTLEVRAGETTLELSAANADAGGAASSPAPPVPERPADATDVLLRWQDGVVAIWTPTTHATGAVIDGRGLIVTSQQAIGTATTVEVQFTRERKTRGTVLLADRALDVAVVRVAPAWVATASPVPLECPAPSPLPLANGQEVVALGTPMLRLADMYTGPVNRVASRTMIAELGLDRGTVGGPVFTAAGRLVGVTSFIEAKEGDPDEDARVVRVDAVCEAMAAAERRLAAAEPERSPSLPTEPARAIPDEALQAAASTRAGSLSPYTLQSAEFEIAFLSPVVTYARRTSMDFSNWSDYVAFTFASVLLVRVTPKQEEGFWTTVARGMARLQGVNLPPIKRFRAGFARMRLRCGDDEVAPIHPFLLERRVSETDAIYEGLYVFDPATLGPHCGTVRVDAFSDKAPATADTATVDPGIVQQIWQDFAPYRALK